MSDKLDLVDFAVNGVKTQLSRAIDRLLAGYAAVIATIRDQLALAGIALSDTAIALIVLATAALAVFALAQMLRFSVRRSIARLFNISKAGSFDRSTSARVTWSGLEIR
jgi:hypothetical protein